MTREDSQAVDILLRDVRLIEETVKLPACDAVTLFERPALAVLANVSPMTASGELLVGAGPPADSAVASHTYHRCSERGTKSRDEASIDGPAPARKLGTG